MPKYNIKKYILARKTLRIIPIVTIVLLVVIILISMIPIATGTLSLHEEEPLTIRSEGAYLKIEGEYSVYSSLLSDISNICVTIDIVDGDNSIVRIYDDNNITIKGENKTPILIEASIFAPSLFFIISNLIDEPSSKIPVKVTISGSYMFEVLNFDTNTMLSVELADSNKTLYVSIETTENSETMMIENLKESLLPNEESISIYDIECNIGITLDVLNGAIYVKIESVYSSGSSMSLQDAFDSILESYDYGGPTIINELTGNSITMSENEMNALSFVATYLWDNENNA